jgi:hypothetical protein
MTQYLCRRFREQGWLEPDPSASLKASLGVVIQVRPSEADDLGETQYIAEPPHADENLRAISERLSLGTLVTMSSDITSFIFDQVGPEDTTDEITLKPHNIIVPVANCLEDVARGARAGAGVTRRDFCCLVRSERLVLVWSRSGEDIMLQAADVESKLMGLIWGAAIAETPARLPTGIDATGQTGTPVNMLGHVHPGAYKQYPGPNGRLRHTGSRPGSVYLGMGEELDEKNLAVVDNVDLGAEDEESQKVAPRPFLLTHSVMVGLAMGLLMVIESLAVRLIVVEIRALGASAYPRLGLLATLPMFMWFTLFFTIVVIGTVFQALGPIGDVKQGNSRFYSSRAPDIRNHGDMEWPHVTIQMPVYKEGLKGVIIPTINSVLAAIRHYEMIGGTASIFVCEDGMQAVKPEVAEMRKQFYRVNGIGWCARPPHGKDGFVRAGKFKKASNMNYSLDFSLRVEDELLRLLGEKARLEGRTQEEFSVEEEGEVYELAMQNILDADGGKTWAEGSVRMGELILIIDCDTRVPVDCLHLGAMEMADSPSVAIIQHASGVMQVRVCPRILGACFDVLLTMRS